MTFLRTHLPVPQAIVTCGGVPRVVVSVVFAKACGNSFGLFSAAVRGIDFALPSREMMPSIGGVAEGQPCWQTSRASAHTSDRGHRHVATCLTRHWEVIACISNDKNNRHTLRSTNFRQPFRDRSELAKRLHLGGARFAPSGGTPVL